MFKPKNYVPYWKQFSKYIRFDRADGKCERCNAPNGQIIERGNLEGVPIWVNGQGEVYSAATGDYVGRFHSYDLDLRVFSRVVLTTAHLDYEGGICDCKEIYGFKCAKPSHVLGLCQSCHLNLDRPLRLKIQAEKQAQIKDAQRGLFQ